MLVQTKKRYYLCKRKRGGESKLLIGNKLAKKITKKIRNR